MCNQLLRNPRPCSLENLLPRKVKPIPSLNDGSDCRGVGAPPQHDWNPAEADDPPPGDRHQPVGLLLVVPHVTTDPPHVK
ncbi:MAG: hypothetical protein ACK53Y_05695, partial [bacterium]